ncbi:MAG: holo-ACP synthase [Defluviitaleaceae bacterium]|nr:holo-ACP synthase [Defluviitaleaceae bacterium]
MNFARIYDMLYGMIIGIGTDIIDIARLKDVKQAFLNRVYTSAELTGLSQSPERRAEQLAGMFAAKEAVAKALGCGFGSAIMPSDIEILRRDGKRPQVRLLGNAKTVSDALGADTVHVSISHCLDYAVAYAVAES